MRIATAAAFILVLALSGPAAAGFIDCNDPGTCGWQLAVNGAGVMNGTFIIGDDGSISAAPANFDNGAGITASLSGVSGNVDPEIVFGIGATNNTSAPVTFSFSFSLPLLGLSAPLDTEATLGTTLTAGSLAAGHLFPTLGGGKIMDSQDITIFPFNTVDKGVDIGDPLDDPAGGFSTLRNEGATSQILAGGPFDVMSVVVAFGLADDNQIIGLPGSVGVGFSGRVTQTPAPEPTALVLLGIGLAAVASLRRRAS